MVKVKSKRFVVVAMFMKAYGSDRIVSGKELSRCFDDLKESLGRAAIETIVEKTWIMYGIILVGRLSYNVAEVEDALGKLLGDSACEMMMESLVGTREIACHTLVPLPQQDIIVD